jgi:predicted dehydrogenase
MPTDTAPPDPTAVPYRPPVPDGEFGIGLVGCGAITEHHLGGYREAGFDVVALCDVVEEKAEARREEFYPDATVYTDHEALLDDERVDVVDVALHPRHRTPVIEDAVDAGRHVLSQKPFVVDLDEGERLVERAADAGVRLAVNQNARWAPHFSYLRNAVDAGVVGDPFGVHFDVHWDHGWIAGTRFEEIDHAILYDFAIHWFDAAACLLDDPRRVSASTAPAPDQAVRPPLLGEAIVEYDDAQASFAFDGATAHLAEDRTRVTGTDGAIRATAPGLSTADVDVRTTVETDDFAGDVALEGEWYDDGFRGTMGELLCAIEEDREPDNSARDNLASLELCFAAVASAEDGEPKVPGEVRAMRGDLA